jgi:branched-chain amino acid transport system substrate-binding protein
MEIKIGVLLPRSDMFPALGMDFLNGLKLSLRKSDALIPKFIIEGIGNATDKNLLKTAEKLVLQEEVDITISFCSVYFLQELVKMYDSYKKPLIHLDLGGSALKKEHTSPYVLHHTLNLWQSAYAAGIYAAKNFGKKAFVAASFYDGGYHLTEGFVRGFAKEGGVITGFHVGSSNYETDNAQIMIDKIKEAKPDVLFALFSYTEGKKIFDDLAKSDLNGSLPIMALPLMTDETINTENHQLDNVHSIASWCFDDVNLPMKEFLSSYEQAYSEAPNIMSLLGYETGLTISTSISSHGKITPKLKEVVQQKIIETPRGSLTYNDFNESQLENFKLRKFQFNQVKYHNTVVNNIDASFSEKLYKEFEEVPYHGWQNPYICT